MLFFLNPHAADMHSLERLLQLSPVYRLQQCVLHCYCKSTLCDTWGRFAAAVAGSADDDSHLVPPRVLAPRQPTIGESLYDAGDYTVKTCPAEIEIRFANEDLFENFKRVLLHRYKSLQWNKFLQRDCARIHCNESAAKYPTTALGLYL